MKRVYLKLIDNIDFEELFKRGFRAKYDEDTGKIKRFIYEEKRYRQNEIEADRYLRFEITEKNNINSGEKFKSWWEIIYVENDFLYLLYDLIEAGLVEKV